MDARSVRLLFTLKGAEFDFERSVSIPTRFPRRKKNKRDVKNGSLERNRLLSFFGCKVYFCIN